MSLRVNFYDLVQGDFQWMYPGSPCRWKRQLPHRVQTHLFYQWRSKISDERTKPRVHDYRGGRRPQHTQQTWRYNIAAITSFMESPWQEGTGGQYWIRSVNMKIHRPVRFVLTSGNWLNNHSMLPGKWNIKTSQNTVCGIKLYEIEKDSMEPVEAEWVLKVCLFLFVKVIYTVYIYIKSPILSSLLLTTDLFKFKYYFCANTFTCPWILLRETLCSFKCPATGLILVHISNWKQAQSGCPYCFRPGSHFFQIFGALFSNSGLNFICFKQQWEHCVVTI